MTPAEFTRALSTIGWTEAEFARRVGAGSKTPREYSAGRSVIPSDRADYLRAVAAAVEAIPVPAPHRRPRKQEGV